MRAGKELTLLDIVFNRTSSLIQKIIRSQNRLSEWYGVLLIAVIFVLIGIGVFILQNKSNPAHISMVFWDIVFMVPIVGSIKIHSDNFTARLREQVIDFVQSGESLDDLERWWNTFTNKKSAAIFIIIFLAITIPFVFILAYLPTIDFPSPVLTFLLLIVQVLCGLGFYNELVILALSLRMRNYQFKLFEADPASSTVIGDLSDIFMGTIYMSAIVAALLTLVTVATEILILLVIILLLIPLWGVTTFFFALIQFSLAKIISRKKYETLNNIHKKIESLSIGQNFMDEKTRQAYNWLLDYYDRVKATRSSAMNIRSTLGFLNSLLLPLLAFVLTNLDEIAKLVSGAKRAKSGVKPSSARFLHRWFILKFCLHLDNRISPIVSLRCCDHGSAHDGQIASDDTPANPVLKTCLAMIKTATQPMRPFEDADAAFDTCVPLTTRDKPILAFMFFA